MRVPLAIAVAASALLPAAVARAEEPYGVWLSESGETRVRVAPCGAMVCGTVLSTKGGGKDELNPDPALRGRDLAGLKLMTDGKPSERTGEWTGTLYNYREGRSYAGKLRLEGKDAMVLSGCVLGGLVCRGQTWTRTR